MSSSSPSSNPETRERLLQAAVSAFGERDYDSVSTREIVEAAAANISAISYHFGGKRGLYLATADYLAQRLHEQMAVNLQTIHQATEDAEPAVCADLLCDFLSGFLEVLLQGDLGASAPGIIFREQHRPTDAYEILYQKLLQPMHETLTALVAAYRGETPESPSAILLAHTLLGQTVIFRIGRTTLLKRLHKPAYTRSDIEQMKRHLSHHCRWLLDAPPISEVCPQ
jgi:TetR/AcrR family transcriptional regulator, regulator of cefoperazone and chloramphenicol sensitivity